jgi:hypothetical protein
VNADIYEKLFTYVKDLEFMGYSLDQQITIEEAKCNTIFAHFLLYMQNLICMDFARSLIILMRYFRDCLNAHGWDMVSKTYLMTPDEKKEEYCSRFNAEYIPELSNLFLCEYLPKQCPKYDEKLAVDTMLFFCNWLHKHKYTASKLERNKYN